MKREYLRRVGATMVAIAGISGIQVANACTGIVLKSTDGITVPGRTMEFSFDILSNILLIPAGTELTALSQDSENTGFKFKAKYGFGGANCLDRSIVVDGVNEKGLYFGAFYFAGVAQFEKLSAENSGKAISSEELGNWILSQYASVKEVREGLKDISVVGTVIKEIQSEAPFHYAVSDASGASIVIEYTKNGLEIHDNIVNAVTNNPTYSWHLTNLRNYVGLNPVNREKLKVGGLEVKPFGQGSGMIGLPGDMSSPARFVRATAFANTALPSTGGKETVFKAFHILNAFDIPKGAIREPGENPNTDYTVWTSVADTKTATYYFKTYKTQAVESVNIVKAVSGLKAPKVIKMETGFMVRDRTEESSK